MSSEPLFREAPASILAVSVAIAVAIFACHRLFDRVLVPRLLTSDKALSAAERAEGLQDEMLMFGPAGMMSLFPFKVVRPEPGGLLAEEMGLGKTIEVLGLILARPRTDRNGGPSTDPSRSRSIMQHLPDWRRPKPVGATLIISPLQIQAQWSVARNPRLWRL